MNRKVLQISFALIYLLIFTGCSSPNNFVLRHQVTGLIQTNSYLLYDTQSKEGALFDVGGSIDSLELIISKEQIKLKYIFITHCHVDHISGVPAINNKYPGAKLCFSPIEYEDTRIYSEWERNFDTSLVASIKKNPAMEELMNFDYRIIGKPDIELTDNQIYKLGELEIRTFLSPGHSRGSICFYAGDVLLSGDVLFYRQVGRTDLPKTGSKEDIVKSVRRLYASLSDETKVYPGHGRVTDIGAEKKGNEEVSISNVNLKN